MNIEKPKIFIITDISSIFDNAFLELESIESNIQKNDSFEKWFLKSTYVYVYTVFETTLYKTYKRILIAFPELIRSLDINDIGIYISSYSLMNPLVEIAVDAFSKKIAYGKITEILKNYNDIVRIGIDLKDEGLINSLKQYKEERNEIVHTGEFSLKSIVLNNELVLNRIRFIKQFLKVIREKFEARYSKYTKQHLIESSWSYVFKQAMPFHLCFNYQKEYDFYCVNKEFVDERAKTLSSAEKMLLVLFLTNYGSGVLDGAIEINELCLFSSLDSYSKNKIGYILELFQKYPYLLQ